MTAVPATPGINRDYRQALILLTLYWVYFAALCAGLLWCIWWVRTADLLPLFRWLLLLLPAGLLLHLLWTSAPRRRPKPFGEVINLNDQPDLRSLIDEVARQLQVNRPDEVRLLPDMNAYMSVRGARSTLGLGLPLLLSLPEPEVRAVVAHELGHLGGGDSARAWRLSGLVGGLFRTTLSLRQGNPERLVELLPQGVSTIAVLYLLLGNLIALPMTAIATAFLRVSARLNHAQELAADHAAQQVAGPEAARTALQRITREAWLFDAFIQQDVLPLAAAGYRVPLADGFRIFLRGEWAERLRGWTSQRLADHEASLSHPSLRTRLGALTIPENLVPAPDAREPRDEHPTDLLRDADALGEKVYQPRARKTLTGVTWAELNDLHWPSHWQQLAQNDDLRVALRHLNLHDLPGVCADLNAHLRARFPQMQYEGVGGDERHALVSWLAVGVLLSALKQGAWAAAQPGHSWAVTRNGQTLTPLTELWAMVTNPQAREQWPTRLAQLGLENAPLLET
ncbi:M48 family metalloprotease [Deinococcus sedimenti]|uniref:Peptidase M48 domain-containing protein n=1 Tax=Deinococcus sedimenti TaxID=1867090 RepID=A0ABQ2S5X5_9DEIO|nr:M48 family metalloprotease [Deinococcus sedimenti]GGS00642.1 hypothetical protein GCM10008960_29170 [Deinococcus sedimenti]